MFRQARVSLSRTFLACAFGCVSLWPDVASGQDSATVPVRASSPRPVGRVEWLPSGIRNTTLGFSAPYPGPGFVTPAEMQSQLDAQTSAANGALAFWLFSRESTSEIVLFQIVNNGTLGRDEASLRSFARGLRGRAQSIQVVEDTVVWNAAATEFRFSVRSADQSYMRYRCLASGVARSEPIIVCVMTQSPEMEALSELRLGLQLTSVP